MLKFLNLANSVVVGPFRNHKNSIFAGIKACNFALYFWLLSMLANEVCRGIGSDEELFQLYELKV